MNKKSVMISLALIVIISTSLVSAGWFSDFMDAIRGKQDVQLSPADGLIAHYKFDGNVNDSIGNHNGTATEVSYVGGKIGQAASFSGTLKSVVNIPFVGTLKAPGNKLTLASWAKTDSFNDNERWIVAQDENIYQMSLKNNKLNCYVKDDGSLRNGAILLTNLTVNAWHHFVCVFDYTTRNITFYEDGNYLGYTEIGGSKTAIKDSSTKDLTLGARPGAYNTPLFLDDLRIYNTTLTSAEVGELFTYTGCTAETNADFCSRLGKNCGSLTADDNCGDSRTVASCGTCSGATPNCNAVTGICGAAACTPNAGVCTGKQCGTFANGTCGNVVCGTCSGATPNCNAVTGICGATVEDCSVLTFDADDYDVFSVNISSQKFFFRARNIQTSGLNDVVSLERVSCGSGGTTEVWQTICAGKKAGDDCISGDIEMTIENVTVPDKKVNISSCGATFELIEDFDAGCSPGSCSDLTPNNTCSDTKPGYCSNGNMVNNCSGCGCSVGICNASGVCAIPDTCIDSDAKNYGNKGNVTLGSEFREDSCEDGRLLEYFCNTSSILTGVVDSELNPCSLSCRDGACLTPAEVAVDNCTDTDGPNNYFLKGNVSSTSLGNFSDFCDTVMIVVEYNCNASSGATGETVVNSSFQCTSGCVNGACVASNDDEDFGLYCAPSSLGGQTNNIPIRSRFKGSDDKTYYCNPLTLGASVAKNNGLACVEDYECNSNVCLDGKCTSISQELAAQKGILQQILCRIKSIFTSETYDHCIAAS